MELVIVFLPFLSGMSCLLFGRFLGSSGISIVTTGSIFVSFICLCYLFYFLISIGGVSYVSIAQWIKIENLEVEWALYFDSLVLIMCFIILLISFFVHCYSISYMFGDPHRGRFMCYLSLFTFFMLILVSSANFLQLFFGWEGVGVCSYLLISFWNTRQQALKSALKAMIVNRVGDFGLLLGIVYIYKIFNTLDMLQVFAMIGYKTEMLIFFFGVPIHALSLIGIFFIIGAIGKSAQIGLHIWLPDAMEGPTPVSALIHAATMVTAGIFLIVRCSYLFEYAPICLFIISVIGGLTSFLGGTIGLVQTDLKKIIAYSTCSQLGYMFFACGLSNYHIAIFHLANHAFFKALLFLGAGSVIHGLNNEQDIRKMGGLFYLFPFTYITMVIGGLSLAGFPFLTGFYSKDLLLENAYSIFSISGIFCYWLGSISAFLTAFYTIRMLVMTFISPPRFSSTFLKQEHQFESGWLVFLVLFLLALGSIIFGLFTQDGLVGLGTNFWGNSIFILPIHVSGIEAEFLSWDIKIFPILLSLLGGFFSYKIYTSYIFIKIFYGRLIGFWLFNKFGIYLYHFLIYKWFFDMFVTKYITNVILYIGYEITFKNLDRGFIEIIGPKGLKEFFIKLYLRIKEIVSGLLSDVYFLQFIAFFAAYFFLCLIFDPEIVYRIFKILLNIMFLYQVLIILNSPRL